jgi:hypothetical protein
MSAEKIKNVLSRISLLYGLFVPIMKIGKDYGLWTC